MDEKQTSMVTEAPTLSAKSGPHGVIFIILSSLALVVIPITIIAAIVISVLLQPSFYTDILKNGRFITAFVQARNWQTEKKVSEEIEKELHLSSFTSELEGKKSRFDEATIAYDKISREGEIESLNKQRNELKDFEWERVKEEFPDKNKFDKNKEDELSKIKERISAIEEYQDKNSDSIKAARKEMEKARDEYDDALSTLEDKKNEADKITEKHKSSLTNTIYADLDIIEKPLTEILNSKLIDGAVRAEVEKALRFFTSYDTQIEHRNIFYQRDMGTEGLGRLSLMVRLPELSISLWITDDTTHRRQHILSELLATEIGKLEDIQNRTMLTTMFKLADSSLGEYLANSYLSKLGMSIDDGVIRISIPVLKGKTAENVASAMEFLSYGQYSAFAAGGLLLLFLVYLFFSAVERQRKLAMIKRLLIYPSVLVLAACGVLVWTSRYIFTYYPDIISNLSARSYAKHLSFTASWHFVFPMVVVFSTTLICGLIIRKYFLADK